MAGCALWIFRDYRNGAGKGAMVFIVLCITAIQGIASERIVTVERLQGDVQVRYGIEEEWRSAVAGDTLRPEDTIRTGKDAFAVLRLHDGTRYRLPAEAMVDGTDFRTMNRQELLLRLAMEDMLSVPDRIDDDRPAPRTTVLHGSVRGRSDTPGRPGDTQDARFRLNGARFLIEQEYTGTAVLKLRETLRLYPEGDYRPDALLLAAESLEGMQLYEEAVRYYSILLDEDVPDNFKRSAQLRLEILREQTER
jgi:hypothetical protein